MHPPKPSFCQSCMDPTGNFPDGGVEIKDGSNFWICDACWGRMSPFERAKLRLELQEMSRTASIEEAIQALRRIREEESGSGEAWRESL